MGRTAESVAAIIKAYDVRGVVGEQIDEDFVRDVGASFARLVRDEAGAATTVVIGYDMRASSPTLSSAFGDGVLAQGLDVVYIGLASTDELYFASGLLNCPGAMFTASHNPAKYNGIKMCRAAPSRSVRTPAWQSSPPRSSRVFPRTTDRQAPPARRTSSRNMRATSAVWSTWLRCAR
ncbi:hypothetical protein GCM10020255_069480 [Rhodococcus baikonurensis]